MTNKIFYKTVLLCCLVSAAVFAAVSGVSAGVMEIECGFRRGLLNSSNTGEITASPERAKLGSYVGDYGKYYYRVYAQFDISALSGKHITGVGFKVYNSGSFSQNIDYLWYLPEQLSGFSDITTLYFPNQDEYRLYSGFTWNINAGGWTSGEPSSFVWENWKRNNGGTPKSLIEDIQAHADDPGKSWFAVGFYSSAEVVNSTVQLIDLRFSDSDKTGDPSSIVMIVEFANDEFVKEKNFGPDCASAGNPVNFATGNKYETQTDTVLSGPGLPMRHDRYYNSQSTDNGYRGYGWTGSFSEHVTPETGKVVLTEADGREVWFTDDGSGNTYLSETGEVRKITENTVTGEFTLTEPDGRKMIFGSAGELKQISDRNGNTQTVTCSSGKPVSVTDNFGRQFTFSYNPAGKLVTLGTPAGNFSYAYDISGNLIRVTKPDGTFRQYRYEDTADVHNLTGIIDETNIRYATFAYDGEDRAVLSLRAGDTAGTRITYPLSMTDPARTVTDPLSNERQFSVSEQKGIGKVGSASGTGCSTCPFSSGNSIIYTEDRYLPETVTDAEENITRHTYDDRGNILTMTEAEGSPEERTTSFTRHPDYSFPATVTRPSVSGGTVTDQYVYDAKGNLLTLTENSGTPAERITAFSWDAQGRMTGIDGPRTDVNDTVTLTYYPAASGGHLQSITDAMNRITVFSDYNAFGKPGRITDANNVITDFTYDTMGRMISKTVAGISTGFAYDNTGKLTKITLPGSREITYEYTDAGLPEKITDNSGNYILYAYDTEGNRKKEEIHGSGGTLKAYTDYAYDEFNRVSQILYPGAGETFGYDGNNNLTSFTDGNGKDYSYVYDALRRITGVTKPGNITETAEYDAADNLKKVTDARTNATDYTYDDAGNLLSADSPDSGNTAYTYDRAGNMTSRTDADNVTVTYDYDILNRMTAINFPDSSQNISYTYDSGTYGIGKLSSVTDPAGSTVFVYNALGQITQETRTADSLTFETVYGYNASTADLNTLTYPSGLILTYQRDADGRISGISADGQTVIGNVTYQPFGPVKSMTAGALSVSRSFDQRYQVSGIQAGTVMNLTYTYDGTGNVKTISGITKPPIAPGTTDYSIPAGTSRISGSTGQTAKTYTYDNAGKITSDGVRTFTYNQNSQLIRVTAGTSVIAEYAYDGFGRRVKKTAGGKTVLYHYDYDGNLTAETDGAGNPLRDYVWLNGEPAGMKLYGTGAGWYWFLNDHLGTPQKMVDSAGQVVWEAGYMPFGEARVLIADIENNLRFPGQYYDKETGLHYNYHRYYDPDTGRYLTPDPIGLEGGLNLYVYVDGNPVNFIDPEGLEAAILPGPVPLPMIIPPKTDAQNEADRQLAEAVHDAWMEYVHPSLTAAGDLLYGGGIGEWIYGITHEEAAPCSMATEHTKNKSKKNWDKHTKRRPGDPNLDKKRQPRERGKKWKRRK